MQNSSTFKIKAITRWIFISILATGLLTSFRRIENDEVAEHIKIGKQIWMSKNLDTDEFNNGDEIFQAKNGAEWSKADREKKPAWCYYNFDPNNNIKYGKLYNWYAVSDRRGLAPKGWHIPTRDEWETLKNYFGGESQCVPMLKESYGWITNNNGTNRSGFSALPAGKVIPWGSESLFSFVGERGLWWTSVEDAKSLEYAYYYELVTWFNYGIEKKGSGLSIRCLKNRKSEDELIKGVWISSLNLNSEKVEQFKWRYTYTVTVKNDNEEDVRVKVGGLGYGHYRNCKEGMNNYVHDGYFETQEKRISGGFSKQFQISIILNDNPPNFCTGVPSQKASIISIRQD